jgi:flagellar hook protein FlgE
MSFQTGLSGLNAASRNLDVIGNNIANANTVGAKVARAEFSEIVAASTIAATGRTEGIGVEVSTVSQQFTQGSVNVTGGTLDLAINGAGFFRSRRPTARRLHPRRRIQARQGRQHRDQHRCQPDGLSDHDDRRADQQHAAAAAAAHLHTDRGERHHRHRGRVQCRCSAPWSGTRLPNIPLTTYGTSVTTYDSQGTPIEQPMYMRKTPTTPTYSNGQSQAAGQVALADFRNVQGLRPSAGGNWVETVSSGQPVSARPGVGKFGALRAGALEESNVDLTAELVNMMTAQRTYQANAQTIKTQDQVMSTLVNLR